MQPYAIYCPSCGQAVELGIAAHFLPFRLAIAQQALRLGTCVRCQRCQTSFIYNRSDFASRSPFPPAPHFSLSSARANYAVPQKPHDDREP